MTAQAAAPVQAELLEPTDSAPKRQRAAPGWQARLRAWSNKWDRRLGCRTPSILDRPDALSRDDDDRD